ncbi:MAG: 30S ribosomal protein S12 methylthiotransferase RimO [Planctomycetota bacterium]|jgi:ribosomal protein S12 methylthiotransferase
MTKPKRQKTATVGFVALGCPKNIVDSEKMLAKIAQAGLLIARDPDNADVVVINTCGFIAPAKDEALEAIRHAADHKAHGNVKKIIVAGCLPERLKTSLFHHAEGIDAIVGLGQRDNIAQIIKKTLNSNKAHAYLKHLCNGVSDDRARLLITPHHSVYLRISEGCDHRCSFCTIPVIRGPFRSKPEELVLAEAAELVSAGAVELNIIGQDTTGYGRDLKTKTNLSNLLTELDKIPNLAWIRLMYLYPAAIKYRLIETIAKNQKVLHYIDMPIQHISDKILRAMRRSDTKVRVRRLIEKLRTDLPDVVLRTTIIAGFPGETERQFNELLDFIKWAKFDHLGCFKYYPEDGTDAAKMPQQVPEETKQKRLEKLMLTQQNVAFTKNNHRIGARLRCLVDSVDNKSTAKARFYGQAPEVDSICIVESRSARPGQFIDTEVVATKDYDLVVRQI